MTIRCFFKCTWNFTHTSTRRKWYRAYITWLASYVMNMWFHFLKSNRKHFSILFYFLRNMLLIWSLRSSTRSLLSKVLVGLTITYWNTIIFDSLKRALIRWITKIKKPVSTTLPHNLCETIPQPTPGERSSAGYPMGWKISHILHGHSTEKMRYSQKYISNETNSKREIW